MAEPLEMTAFAKEMLRLGRNDQPGRLWRAWYGREIDIEELREWILPVWQAAEFPATLGHALWLEMFAATGYVDDSGIEEWEAPPDPLTVYRGASVDRSRGLSWTWDFERAEWFANPRRLRGQWTPQELTRFDAPKEA